MGAGVFHLGKSLEGFCNGGAHDKLDLCVFFASKLTGGGLIRPSRTRLIGTMDSLSVGLPLQHHRCVLTKSCVAVGPQSRSTTVCIPVQ